jgi:hypothetical protein
MQARINREMRPRTSERCAKKMIGGTAYRWAEGGGLRDELAGAAAVEAPAVVHALEPALVVDAALGERRQAVRARVVEHAPLAGASVVPGHHADPQHHLAVRRAGVEVLHGGEGVPLVQPVEPLLLLPGRRLLLRPRRLGRHGRGRQHPRGPVAVAARPSPRDEAGPDARRWDAGGEREQWLGLGAGEEQAEGIHVAGGVQAPIDGVGGNGRA